MRSIEEIQNDLDNLKSWFQYQVTKMKESGQTWKIPPPFYDKLENLQNELIEAELRISPPCIEKNPENLAIIKEIENSVKIIDSAPKTGMKFGLI